jgi:uncharacterized protein YceK
MRGTYLVVPALVVCLASAGCATSSSLTDKKGCSIYGGTKLDGAIVSEALGPHDNMGKKDGLEPPILLWEACCGLADMPLSFVADTVLLPVTVPLSRNRQDDPSAADSSQDRLER